MGIKKCIEIVFKIILLLLFHDDNLLFLINTRHFFSQLWVNLILLTMTHQQQWPHFRIHYHSSIHKLMELDQEDHCSDCTSIDAWHRWKLDCVLSILFTPLINMRRGWSDHKWTPLNPSVHTLYRNAYPHASRGTTCNISLTRSICK